MPTELEIAYAAGIWEGEGCSAAYCGSGPTRKGKVFAVSVHQKNPALLEWLKERFGGGVYQGYGKSRQCGEWRTTGNNGYAFFKMIQPFIIGRTGEIECMLLAWENRADSKLFVQYATQAKEAKKKEH